jgi:hypothetical protein
MKVYLILTPANEYSAGDTYVYSNRSTWLKELHDRFEEGQGISSDEEFIKKYNESSDCQAFEVDLIGPDKDPTKGWETVVVLIRPQNGLRGGWQGTVGVYSTPAHLPQLLHDDELNHVHLES